MPLTFPCTGVARLNLNRSPTFNGLMIYHVRRPRKQWAEMPLREWCVTDEVEREERHLVYFSPFFLPFFICCCCFFFCDSICSFYNTYLKFYSMSWTKLGFKRKETLYAEARRHRDDVSTLSLRKEWIPEDLTRLLPSPC